MKYLSKIKQYKLSEIFFWLFIVSLPFNKRIIYQPENAYIQGYFSYYLAMFLYISDILLIICFMCNIVENWANIRAVLPKYGKYMWISLLFLVSAILGWFHVKHLELYALGKVIELILLVYLIPQILKKQTDLLIPLGILYLSAILQAMLGIWQFHVQHQVGFSILGEYVSQLGTGGLATIDTITGKVIRAYGTFPHPNILGAFLNLGLATGYHLVSRATKGKFWLILANIVLILGIFTTFSRVAWIVSCATTVVFLIYLYYLTKKPVYWPILISAIVSCATILLFWHGMLFSRISNIQGSNSYIERGTYNTYGWEILKSNPLGTGIGNYIPTMIAMFHPPESTIFGRAGVQPWDYQPPHNIFIYVGATFGWLGLILFVVFLGFVLRDLWKSEKNDLKFLLFVILGSLLFMSLFDHFLVTIQQGQLMLALIFGLIFAYVKNSDAPQT